MRSLLLLLLLTSSLWGSLPVRTFLDSSYLIRGEVTHLTIETTGELEKVDIPKASEYELTYVGGLVAGVRNNERLYHYQYSFSSLYLGDHTIPAFDVLIDGQQYKTAPQTFSVLPSSELEFNTVKIGDNEVQYATKLFLPKRDLYIGETVPAEIKVYLPDTKSLPPLKKFDIKEKGLPEQKRDGISVWRFQANQPGHNRNYVAPSFLLPTGLYYAVTYKSSAHAIRSGAVSLGPGDIRPVFRAVQNNNGLPSWQYLPINLPIDQITREALPLPAGAPKSFKGAVGQFELEVEIENSVRSASTDPVSAKITISGSGNLEKLEAPDPVAQEGDWTLYPAVRAERDAERRYLSGSVEFTQLLRPTSEQDSLPAFEFSYFDPEVKEYRSLTSEPIPLFLKATANPSPQGASDSEPRDSLSQGASDVPKVIDTSSSDQLQIMPREAMSGVLGLLSPPYRTNAIPTSVRSYWQLIPAVLTLALMYLVFTRHLAPRLKPSEDKRQAKQALQDLKGAKDPVPFLKQAASYAQCHLTQQENQGLRAELDRLRDTYCYRATADKGEFSTQDRKQLLSRIQQATKTALPILLGLLILTPTESQAQEDLTEVLADEPKSTESYYQEALKVAEEGAYAKALSLFFDAHSNLDFPSDVLYNIGTSYAKIDEPGMAVLYLRRTLLQDPMHKEAKQNLRYLERRNGSLIVQRRGLSKHLAKLPQSAFQTLLVALAWALVICVLALCLLSRGRARVTVWTVLALTLLLLPAALIAVLWYPNDGEFAAIETLTVVTSPTTVTARTSASSTADQVIKTPPGSLAKVIKQRGLWVYLEFANSTRGWLSTQHLSMLSPQEAFDEITEVEPNSDL